jgi:two-component system, OmpR family, sensor histidine kinase KdpD
MRALSTRRPPLLVGVGLACALIAVETLTLYPLGEAAPSVSLGVVYLVGVLIVAIVWGAWLGVATSLVSATAFNFFHIPPTGRFTIAEAENWVALAVFLLVALVAASLAEAARHRAQEAEQRGREAVLAAELARVVLGAPDLSTALGPAAQRIARAFGLPSCRIVLEAVEGDERTEALPLRHEGRELGTLLVPRATSAAGRIALVERVQPALEALLDGAREREALTREVVETRALRRSDEIKTAVLRAVSHDLRSPLTAIVTAADALATPSVGADDRHELAAAIGSESARLTRLVDKLLDLSRLQAGAADPQRDWCSIEEVLREAVATAGAPAGRFKLVIDRNLPLVVADAAQLERAFGNLLENAVRYSGDEPVSVRARASGGRVLVRIVDRGPGIALADQEHIFEPFFRTRGARAAGSGLGLAIVRGFVEANGGEVRVESLPGQGTSFVVSLPLPERAPLGVPG